MKHENYGFVVIFITAIAVLIAFIFSDRVPQDVIYHSFSDTKRYLLIPNALNVLSNIPFLIVGIAGLFLLCSKKAENLNVVSSNYVAYFILFLGVALVGLGSSYYHLWPSNKSLVWDRLPMTIAFMALYSILISEYISETKGRLLLVPLLLVGLSSVMYWWYTESRGVGDLRYYAIVQFYPMLTIPVILLFFKSKYCSPYNYWLLLGFYGAAKVFESFDSQIHEVLVVVSGHSIKHVLPVVGLYMLLKAYNPKNRDLRSKSLGSVL